MRHARYVTIHMENDPYALGMAGPNAPIYRLPAVVAPHPAGRTTPTYTPDELRVLHPFYSGRLDVNDAIRRTRDDGLGAEVHRYRNLVDEQAQKKAEVDRLQDRLSDVLLELRACITRLTQADVIQRIEEKRGGTAQRVSAWSFERGRSTLGRG